MKDIDEANTEANSRKHHQFLNTFVGSRASQQTPERQDAVVKEPCLEILNRRSQACASPGPELLRCVQERSDLCTPARRGLQATGGNDVPTDPGLSPGAPRSAGVTPG